MSRRAIGATIALAGATLVAAGSPAALGASRTITLEGWAPRVLAFSGQRLIWTEAATVRVDPARIGGSPAGAARFDYYRAEAFRVPLNRRSTRFAGDAEVAVSVRTSIASMAPGVLSPTGDGGFVMVPESRRFAPPVIWCCSAEGVESVVESDGRESAPITVAAAWAAGSVRYLQMSPTGPAALRIADLTGARPPETRPSAAATARGLVAVSSRAVGWVDPAAPTTLLLQSDGGLPVSISLPGPALRIWSAPRLFVVATRVGTGAVLLRIDESAAPRAVRVWSGTRPPRVALGGGAIAVSDGRRVLAARRGPLRPIATGRRVIDAVGVDDRRLAWIERGTRRGARVGVVRLGRIP